MKNHDEVNVEALRSNDRSTLLKFRKSFNVDEPATRSNSPLKLRLN